MPILSLQQARLDLQVRKALERAAADRLDLVRLKAQTRDATPDELDDAQAKTNRLRFLGATSLSTEMAERALERIISGNELQPVNYLELGALAARAICRIDIADASGRRVAWGSGFLIAPRVLLTNNHVLPGPEMARGSIAEFDYELDALGRQKDVARFALAPDDLFFTHPELDFTVVAVAERGGAGQRLSDYGFLPLIGALGKVLEGEWLTIIQHPQGGLKQVCVRENHLMKRTDDLLWYSTDTLGGSSGAPVFNNAWQVVALHHSGVPETKDGRWQTIDGRDYDPANDSEDAIKWVANEGIRISRIVQTLKGARAADPLLADVFDMTPARANDLTQRLLSRALPSPPPAERDSRLASGSADNMSRSVTVTLDISDDGRVSLRDATSGAVESWLEKAVKTKVNGVEVELDIDFDPDYTKRNGYQEDFLNSRFKVHAPQLRSGYPGVAAPMIGKPKTSTKAADYILTYTNYSVMMHAKRRLALWTAANIDGGNRFKVGRTRDTWRFDPRLPREQQLGDFYYKGNNFDRGHLTRREDMEYGKDVETAIEAADDTCHWTNCTPQHAKFNGLGYIWQELERHFLENAIKSKRFAAQVFTGPILSESDPTYSKFPDIQYPTRYWKIGAAISASGELFAAGFILDQGPVIDKFGIEAAPAVPFEPFHTYQTPIADIEEETGLVFTFSESAGGAKSLSTVDPLAGSAGRATAARRRRTRSGAREAYSGADMTPGHVLIDDLSAVILQR